MEHDHNESNRHRSDALAHYIREIHWFNLIFVTANIHMISINFNIAGINAPLPPGMALACRVGNAWGGSFWRV